jgi:hypothetical protein
MNKTELLKKCKEMGIKGISAKTKNELIELIEKHELPQLPNLCLVSRRRNVAEPRSGEDNIQKPTPTPTPTTTINYETMETLLAELRNKITKDKSRKVCKNCHELGHNSVSPSCKFNVEKNNKHQLKIKNHILSQNCLEDTPLEDYLNELSIQLDITPNCCKTLYNEIPPIELLERRCDIEGYMQNINNNNSAKCGECDKRIYCIQQHTQRSWKGTVICDKCWCKYEDCRKSAWEQIRTYKLMQCQICKITQTHPLERFHYDHLNMFCKTGSVCSMVSEGVDIQQIFGEIDKCQILCLSCHHIVTDIEHKLGFTRVKQLLTRSLNQNEMTEEEYVEQTGIYQLLYERKMLNIYGELSKICQPINK